jgi:hypothetical protein
VIRRWEHEDPHGIAHDVEVSWSSALDLGDTGVVSPLDTSH